MRLWHRALGAAKDHNSLWRARVSRRTAHSNPDIEKAVIRSTAHAEPRFDCRYIDRVCELIRGSPNNLRPVLGSVSDRIARSRDWVVVLKGLYLMHNVINTKLPCVRKIGRLPFDLSNFRDAHVSPERSWPFEAFVRAYYAFLDKKSFFNFQKGDERGEEGLVIMRELLALQRQQALIDLLMQIKPQPEAAFVPMILDVMDGIIIEIYDAYSRICRGIAIILMNIYSAGKAEANIALEVVKKATQQGEDLAYYFEFCHELGCFYSTEFPVVHKIPEDGIHELEEIIKSLEEGVDNEEGEEEKAIIVFNSAVRDDLRTVITDKWERFDNEDEPCVDPSVGPLVLYKEQQPGKKLQELPDLISL